MQRTVSLAALLLALSACAVPLRAPPRLPAQSAPLELRVAAYRANAATIRASLWRSWRLQVGDERSDRALAEARPLLENAPEASRLMRERDRQMALGWALFGGGVVATLGGAVALPLTLGGGADDRSALLVPVLVSLAGTVVMAVSSLVLGAAEPTVTLATEAYNRWLWDALALPRAGSTPHPALPSAGMAPWTVPPP